MRRGYMNCREGKGIFFSIYIQLELRLRPCKPHFKRQIRNKKGYVLFTKSYMT